MKPKHRKRVAVAAAMTKTKPRSTRKSGSHKACYARQGYKSLILKVKIKSRLTAKRRAATTSLFQRATVVEIDRYDWKRWPQTICLRLLPTMRPEWFNHRIRVIQAAEAQA